MQVNCPQCQAEIALDDIDLGLRVGKCRSCAQVVNIADQLSGIAGPAADRSPQPRQRDQAIVPQPASLRIEEEGQSLVISKRWFHPAAFFLLFFCIAWDSFLFVWYSIAFGMFGAIQAPGGLFGWLFIIFPIGHVAVGIGLTYTCVATFLNSTTLTVRDGFLSLRHGPMFWPGQCVLSTDDIEQIYVKSLLRLTSQRQVIVTHGSGASQVYGQLMAVLKSGGERKIWGHEIDPGVIRCIEFRVERFLEIEDRPVAGELR